MENRAGHAKQYVNLSIFEISHRLALKPARSRLEHVLKLNTANGKLKLILKGTTFIWSVILIAEEYLTFLYLSMDPCELHKIDFFLNNGGLWLYEHLAILRFFLQLDLLFDELVHFGVRHRRHQLVVYIVNESCYCLELALHLYGIHIKI